MKTVNIHEAKTHLSRLVEEAANGEPFIIAKAGRPMVKVAPLEETAQPAKRRLGGLEGMFTIPDDFDNFGREEIDRMFFGEE
jgi:prevent-host-death family protein